MWHRGAGCLVLSFRMNRNSLKTKLSLLCVRCLWFVLFGRLCAIFKKYHLAYNRSGNHSLNLLYIFGKSLIQPPHILHTVASKCILNNFVTLFEIDNIDVDWLRHYKCHTHLENSKIEVLLGSWSPPWVLVRQPTPGNVSVVPDIVNIEATLQLGTHKASEMVLYLFPVYVSPQFCHRRP